jgi:hypothetical protein
MTQAWIIDHPDQQVGGITPGQPQKPVRQKDQQMTRVGIDCTGGNAGFVRAALPLPDVMMWYGTGSPSVEWTESERTLFPVSMLCEIDQGGLGTPVLTATVRDVESGAWVMSRAVDRSGWDVPRPTLYMARNSIQSAIAAGWKGDVWLSWPGWNGEALPDMPGCTIVAVQNDFYPKYDHSIILDPAWPHEVSATPPDYSLSVTVTNRMANMAFSEVPNADHYVIQYQAEPATTPVLLSRETAESDMGARHVTDVHVPGSRGGAVIVHAITDGKAALVGISHLP